MFSIFSIADLSVAKPAEWDDRAKIPDVKVPKPEGWLDDVLPTIDDPGEWQGLRLPIQGNHKVGRSEM